MLQFANNGQSERALKIVSSMERFSIACRIKFKILLTKLLSYSVKRKKDTIRLK